MNKLYESRYHKQQQISGLSSSNKLAAGYYCDEISKINKNIKRLQMDTWYDNIINSSIDHTVDFHGVHRQFIEEYLHDIIYHKFSVQKFNEIKLITGRGARILHKKVKEGLIEIGYKYKVVDDAQFVVRNK